MRSLYLPAGAAVTAVAAAWLLVFAPRLELAHTRLDHAAEQIKAASQQDMERLAVIEAQAEQLASVLLAEQQNRDLLAQLASQGRAHTQALQELKRHDEKIIDYLHQPVPAELGRLYQRPETTDPARYRKQAGLPAGTVPAASTAGTGGK